MKYFILILLVLQTLVFAGCFEKQKTEEEVLTSTEEVATEWTMQEEASSSPQWESDEELPKWELVEWEEGSLTQDKENETVTPSESTPLTEGETSQLTEPETSPARAATDSNTEPSDSTTVETEAQVIAEYEEDLEALFDDLLRGAE